ncbi:hypothetical protein DPMN_084762 [Dreissena polymorpha]|uniref:Uncharacterized protein n=1 Tax=Dreissena polymorpha TaxID=45954 RepID=A0A9D4BIT6_DREPO|nr:hypothetical protein DPMN_084762 [Dreissena polymorpha]
MENQANIGATPLKTRSSRGNFDWNTQCFICGENCNPNRDNSSRGYSRSSSLVETVDSVDPANSINKKLLEIPLQTNDTTIINRLTTVANGDLVAVNARYHRQKGCLTKNY